MTGTTHVVIAAASCLAVADELDASINAVQWLFVFFGALAPDIDSASSTISRPGTLFRRILPRPLVALLNLFGWGVSRSLGSVVRHRGFFHWPLLGLSLLAASLHFQSSPLFWFSIAYCSHILADACTTQGIPFLAPFRNKAISLFPLTTGSFSESIVAFGFSLLVLWQLFGESQLGNLLYKLL